MAAEIQADERGPSATFSCFLIMKKKRDLGQQSQLLTARMRQGDNTCSRQGWDKEWIQAELAKQDER